MNSSSQKKFFYNIADMNFTLEEIKHGLLRNNAKAPNAYFRCLSSNDERLNVLSGYSNPRILFVCLDFPECLEQIDTFTGDDEEVLEQELNTFVTSILETKVNIDLDQHEVCIPKLFQDYMADFNHSEENVLEFIFGYIELEHESEHILELVKAKQVIIKYEME